MTSDDTHARTLELLELNSYFGMKSTQVKLLKQEKVACLDDNDARLAIEPQNKYKIQTKPHCHGDVHSLLYSSSLLNSWDKCRSSDLQSIKTCHRISHRKQEIMGRSPKN
ncbi:UDP-sugar pyrophosphorylase-like isoform X1 [Magnolia sinica]|uniref:UDP-sugar pyrophosphorylase-like isoform X1 n=1 Tax=Magnolia sinica TaxID=86752 RepID=UPI002657ED16|nr:UDP-sugar pyrophosphorylase-like isoform X1 [Magnolia sinica]